MGIAEGATRPHNTGPAVFIEVVARHLDERRAAGLPIGFGRDAAPNPHPYGARWWDAVRSWSSTRLGVEALLTAHALAGLADTRGEVWTTERSLADAVGRPDPAGRLRATTERGLAGLTDAGLVEVVNPSAPRNQRRVLRLLSADTRTLAK